MELIRFHYTFASQWWYLLLSLSQRWLSTLIWETRGAGGSGADDSLCDTSSESRLNHGPVRVPRSNSRGCLHLLRPIRNSSVKSEFLLHLLAYVERCQRKIWISFLCWKHRSCNGLHLFFNLCWGSHRSLTLAAPVRILWLPPDQKSQSGILIVCSILWLSCRHLPTGWKPGMCCS